MNTPALLSSRPPPAVPSVFSGPQPGQTRRHSSYTHSPRREAAAVTSLSTDTDVFLIVVGGARLVVCPRWGHTRGELTYSVLGRRCPLTLGLVAELGATVLMVISERKEADVGVRVHGVRVHGVRVHGEHPQNSKRTLVFVFMVNTPKTTRGSWCYCVCVRGEHPQKRNRKLVLVFVAKIRKDRTGGWCLYSW